MTLDFGGMPFVDRLFRPQRLLAAVLAMRCDALGILQYARTSVRGSYWPLPCKEILGFY